MKNLIKKIKSIRITTQQEIEDLVDNALTKYRKFHDNETIQDKFSEEYANSFFNSEQTVEKEKFLQKIQSIKNAQIKDVINSSFDFFPEESISFEELKLIQSAIRAKYNTDPIWQGAVDSFVDYTISTGITVSTPVDEINSAITQFRKRNKMGIRDRNIVKDLFMDGEYFFLLFNDNQGNVYLRKSDPKSIVEIEVDPMDIEAKFSYKREFVEFDSQGNPAGTTKSQRILDINYQKYQNFDIGYKKSVFLKDRDFVRNVVCKHIKLSEEDQLRGRPPGRTILKFLKMYENFLLDRMILNHERSKVVWIKEIRGRNTEDLTKGRLAPKGGMMLLETEGVKYRIESSKLEASEAKEDALHLLYYISSGIRFPLHVINQRTDQQVYSSIRKADTPFSTMITSFQSMLAYEMEEIYRYQIKLLVDKGKLKKQYKYPSYSEESLANAAVKELEMEMNGATKSQIYNEVKKIIQEGLTEITKDVMEVPINQEFPQVVWQDPKEMAEVLKTHDEMKIASKLTLSSRAGYDGKKELARRIKEEEVSGLNFDKKKFEEKEPKTKKEE